MSENNIPYLSKPCTKCKQIKLLSEFNKNKAKKDGLCSDCKTCKKQYYKDNPEKIAKYNKKYNKNNADKIVKQTKQYRENNPEKIRANDAKRRATKLQATPSWYEKEAIENLYSTHHYFRELGREVHVDHIVPLTHPLVCGLHCLANLELIYASENLSKSNTFEI